MKTVAEVLDEMEFLDGISKNSCAAMKWLNAARSLLWNLGDFPGTIGYACKTLPSNGCFYLPWDAQSIKSAWSCKELKISSMEWRSISQSDFQCCNPSVDEIFPTFVQSPLPCNPGHRYMLGFLSRDTDDTGKKVYIGAISTAGSRESQEVVLAGISEIVYADVEIKDISAIRKDLTVGRVDIYVKNVSDQCEYKVGFLDPRQTTSSYTQYQSKLCRDTCSVLKYKKRIIPFSTSDLNMEADIDNATALSLAIDSIKLRQERSYSDAANALKLAKGYIDVEKQDIRPKGQLATFPKLSGILD